MVPKLEATRRMRSILEPYRGEVIAMNLSDPKKLELTRLLDVHDEFATVKTRDGRLHVPFRWIMESRRSARTHHFG